VVLAVAGVATVAPPTVLLSVAYATFGALPFVCYVASRGTGATTACPPGPMLHVD